MFSSYKRREGWEIQLDISVVVHQHLMTFHGNLHEY